MIKFLYDGNKITAGLYGEIDHHNATIMREKLDLSIKENIPEELILDFENITFMDSSGVGLIMGRYKLMNELDGKIIIKNTSPQIKKIMKLSGIDKLAQIL